MAAIGYSSMFEIGGLVDHRTRAGKSGRRGTPSRRPSRVARAPRSA